MPAASGLFNPGYALFADPDAIFASIQKDLSLKNKLFLIYQQWHPTCIIPIMMQIRQNINIPIKKETKKMKNIIKSRALISPFTSITFISVAITGLLLTFHIKNGGIKTLHEWIGYAFVAAGLMHLIINWKAFASYLVKRRAITAIAAGVVASFVLFYAGGASSMAQKPNPMITMLDTNKNGVIDAAEISSAEAALNKLDKNLDGMITAEELMSKHGKSARPSR